MTTPSATRKAKPLAVFGGDITVTCHAGKQDTDGQYALYEITCQPGGGPPLHVHSDVDESFYVLDGTFQFQIGEEQATATAGWFRNGPRQIPHAFRACGSTPSRMLFIVSPAGLEDFFVELSALTADHPADPASVTTLFEQHGMTIVGPQLALPGSS